MAETFDPGPIAALLDQAAERFAAATDASHNSYDATFATRIAQAKHVLDEYTHHHNNVLTQPVSRGGLVPDADYLAALEKAS